jgi:hypothetical protein
MAVATQLTASHLLRTAPSPRVRIEDFACARTGQTSVALKVGSKRSTGCHRLAIGGNRETFPPLFLQHSNPAHQRQDSVADRDFSWQPRPHAQPAGTIAVRASSCAVRRCRRRPSSAARCRLRRRPRGRSPGTRRRTCRGAARCRSRVRRSRRRAIRASRMRRRRSGCRRSAGIVLDRKVRRRAAVVRGSRCSPVDQKCPPPAEAGLRAIWSPKWSLGRICALTDGLGVCSLTAETQRIACWGTWTRTKNKGTRNLRVANYTIPQGAQPKPVPRDKST